jgi:hypothetical protein
VNEPKARGNVRLGLDVDPQSFYRRQDANFSPTIPATISPMQARRSVVAGSLKR